MAGLPVERRQATFKSRNGPQAVRCRASGGETVPPNAILVISLAAHPRQSGLSLPESDRVDHDPAEQKVAGGVLECRMANQQNDDVGFPDSLLEALLLDV